MILKCFLWPSCSLELLTWLDQNNNILVGYTVKLDLKDWLLTRLGFVLQQFIIRQQFRRRVSVWGRDGPTKRGSGGEEKADSDTSEQTLAHEEETQMPEVNWISSYSLFELLFQSPLNQMKFIYLAWVSCLFMCFIKAYKLLCFCFLAFSRLLMHFKLMFKGALIGYIFLLPLKIIFRKYGSNLN